jgi:hypothetical protein
MPRFASARASRAALIATALLIAAPARADDCPAPPEVQARIKAEEEACAKKTADEVCVRVRDMKNCPIGAVVNVGPNADKGPWRPKTFAHGIGIITCPHAETWVFVEPARGHSWQAARLCDPAGMQFKFRPAGASNYSRPQADEARSIRRPKAKR